MSKLRPAPESSCEGCIHFGIKDEGWGPFERHDDYCFRFHLWKPDRCARYKHDEPLNDETV